MLTEQKHPSTIVDRAIKKARALDRSQIINQPRPNVPKNQQANLVVTYSDSLPNVNIVLRKHLKIPQQSDTLNTLFPVPLRVVYRWRRNFKDVLVRSKISASWNFDCQPCGNSLSQACDHKERTSEIKSAQSELSFKISLTLNWDTKNVIYVLRCNLYNEDYIGQTGTLFRKHIQWS